MFVATLAGHVKASRDEIRRPLPKSRISCLTASQIETTLCTYAAGAAVNASVQVRATDAVPRIPDLENCPLPRSGTACNKPSLTYIDADYRKSFPIEIMPPGGRAPILTAS